MWRRPIKALGGGVTVLGVALLTVMVCGIMPWFQGQTTGTLWWAEPLKNLTRPVMAYLGYSIFFFIPVLLGYGFFFVRLNQSLSRYRSDPAQAEKIRFYNGAMEILITLFFAIGVIFTAWGLQNALTAALGGIGKAEASRLGAWGILKSLVDNGILIALWTTIVGGTGGYLMRLGKYFFLGKALNRYTEWRHQQDRGLLFEGLESIRGHVEEIEGLINEQYKFPKTPHPYLKAEGGAGQ